MTIFDDDGFGIDFAFGLGAGEEIADFDRTKKIPDDPEPITPEDNKEQWEQE